MKPLSLLCSVLLVILSFQAAFAANSLWTSPEIPAVPTDLPRLTQPLTLDGDISEWASAASVPILGKTHIFSKPDEHVWNGPADAGMEVYCAWNSDGLCLAARITDNEIINDQSRGSDYYIQDCVEIFLDGRTDKEFMSVPYTFGAYQALVRPPMPDKSVDVGMNPRDGMIEGLKYAGKSTKDGYNIEMLVPWSAFPKFKPASGSLFGMQFALDDWDKRDEEFHERLQLAYNAQALLSQRPDLFIKWRLVDSLSTADTLYGVQATLDTPTVCSGSKPLNAGIQIGTSLAPKVGSVDMRWIDSSGKVLLEKTLKPSHMTQPWSSVLSASTEYLPKQISDGYGIFSATIIGKDGSALQTISTPVLSVGGIMPDALARIKKADVAKLSQTQPFKAAQYLAAAACIETMKRGIEIEDNKMTVSAAQQVKARLDVLEGNPVDSDAGIYGLTTLTADPDAQVIVEYLESDEATIQLLCGSISYAWADVQQLASENEATTMMVKGTYRKNSNVLADLSEQVTIAGLPARVSMQNYAYKPVSRTKDLDPAKYIVLTDYASRQMIALEVGCIKCAIADAAVILDGCPAATRTAVENWSKKHNVPIINKVEDITEKRFLIAGDITGAQFAEKLKRCSLRTYGIEDNYCDIKAAWGKNLVWAMGPSRPAAEKLIGLIKAGRPITSADADAIRQEVVETVRPNITPQPLPEGSNMYCGDLHMHTFYSDGSPSPVGLMCEAIYCKHDFDAMTDHNTIDGAKYACKLLKQFAVAHPVIVGEEVTTFFHANAYPLKEVVDASKSLHEITKAAHAQGAVIQWNHPGWPDSDWASEQMKNGISGTAFDAWEHIPSNYDEWKSAGKLPPLIGSTDTHDGTYAWGERTVVISPSTDGADIAECIRANRIALVCPMYGLVYGPDDIAATVFAALAEGKALKEAKALDLKNTLKNADLTGLLDASTPRVVEK